MRLYLIPQACSLAVHIALLELGIGVELVLVDSKTKRTSDGRDYLDINRKGYVAALELEDGTVLTEVAAILLYLAENHLGNQMLPRASVSDIRVYEWLNFISSELQARFDLFFVENMPDQAKDIVREKIIQRLDFVADSLADQRYLVSDTYSIADIYLFTIARWSEWFSIDLARWSALVAFMERMKHRPQVASAIEAEIRLKPSVKLSKILS